MKRPLKIIIIAFLSICFIAILHSCRKITEPEVATIEATEVTAISAVSGGNVINNGGAEVTARGVCWSTSEELTINSNPNKTSNGDGNGRFTSEVTGLIANTLYYIRAYATNSEGTGYGNKISFTTKENPPVAAFTASATNITAGQSVQFTDQSTNNPASWSWNFGDGSTSTTKSPAHVYSTAGTYTVSLTATNSAGSDIETKTNYIIVNVLPVYVSSAIENATPALIEITFNLTLANIVPASSSFTVLVNSITRTVSSVAISGAKVLLTLSSPVYYGNAVTVSYVKPLTNPLQIASGEQAASFSSETVTNRTNIIEDNDGNTYKTVTIGLQVWMAENLKTTKYNDGSLIPLVTGEASWAALRTHAYCWYDNNAATNKGIYGALYNWYVVNTGKLCPSGWHVPTDNEWTTLINYLGGFSIAGGKMKETGTDHWVSPNTGATNSSGFTCRPGGIRHSDGVFEFIGTGTQLWTSWESDAANAWSYGLDNIYESIYRESNFKYMGQSVRCVKD